MIFYFAEAVHPPNDEFGVAGGDTDANTMGTLRAVWMSTISVFGDRQTFACAGID